MANSATELKPEVIEIQEPVEAFAKDVVLPTRAELKEKGWSAKEMDAAEKHGMAAKDEPKKDEPKKDEPKKDEPKKDEPKKDEPKKDEPKKDEPKKDEIRGSSLPDFAMTPEQEKVFLETFGPGAPARGLYFRMKNERQARQQEKARADALEARLKLLESSATASAATQSPLVDADGNVIDPENQPLTLKALKEMQQAEIKAAQERENALAERVRSVTAAQVAQEEYARATYVDFDATVSLAKEVMQNLDAIVSNKDDREDVLDLIEKLQIAAANADKIELDGRHAATIAYKIGKFHPKYGKPAGENSGEPNKTGTPKDPKDGALSPEQMKRIEANNLRRASSASVADGGGKRTISIDEVDLSTLNKMTASERLKFREKHPDRYAKLLRG